MPLLCVIGRLDIAMAEACIPFEKLMVSIIKLVRREGFVNCNFNQLSTEALKIKETYVYQYCKSIKCLRRDLTELESNPYNRVRTQVKSSRILCGGD